MPRSLLRTTALRFLSIAALAAALAACGGGGGGGGGADRDDADASALAEGRNGSDGGTAPSQPASAVAAPFAAGTGTPPGYFLNGVGSQVMGQLDTFTQSASGAMTALNDRTLTGTATATQDISGDAFHAQGRWTLGTVTSSAGADVLRGNNAAYHYLAYRRLTAFPASGTFACDAGRFTAPTYVGGALVPASAHSGTATGSASLTFDGSGATVTARFSVQAGSGADAGSDTGDIAATVTGPTHSSIGGDYLGGSAGTVTAIGDGGGGSYLVAVAYKAALSNGAHYQGMASFRCR